MNITNSLIREQMYRTMCEKLHAINTVHQKCLSGYKSDVQLLGRGVFYPPQYYFLLKEMNQTARIDAFLKKEYFHQGLLSTKYFTFAKTEDLGNFVIKKDVLPSDAIKSIFEGLCLMGCEQVIQAVEYAALLEVLGTEKFNALFTSLQIAVDHDPQMKSPLQALRIYKFPRQEKIQEGDVVYFENHRDYNVRHLGGVAQGYYTLCMNGKFAAFGLPPGGSTCDEIKAELIKEFNRDPHSLEYLPARIRSCFEMLMKIGASEINAMKKQITSDDELGQMTLMHRLDFDKITRLANSSIEECRKLLI